jgi:hypothetical protein
MNAILKLKRILDGKVLFSLPLEKIDGYIRDPTIWEDEIFKSQYKEFYENGIKEGLISEHKALDLGIKKGIWKEEWNRTKLDNDIQKLHEEIYKNKFFIIQAAKLEFELKELEKLKKEQNEAYGKIIKQNTANYFALTSIIITKMEKLVVIINGEITSPDIYYLIHDIYDKNSITEKDIRTIARSSVWSIMVKAAKEGVGKIFENLNELTILQYSLLNWSNVYNYAYNSLERPSQDIINDDVLFDKWLDADLGKQEFGNKPKYSDSKEVFIPSDRKGAEKVYEMNDPKTRSGIKARQELIKEKGTISEAELAKKTNTVNFSTLNKKGEL